MSNEVHGRADATAALDARPQIPACDVCCVLKRDWERLSDRQSPEFDWDKALQAGIELHNCCASGHRQDFDGDEGRWPEHAAGIAAYISLVFADVRPYDPTRPAVD
ncbi:hypothetical protein ACWCQL_08560 [Streptomyces sp. NPDC002073]